MKKSVPFTVLAAGMISVAPLGIQQDEFVGRYPAWSPDGQTIVFYRRQTADGPGDIYVSQPDGSHERRITDHPANDAVPKFSRDGEWIAFVSERDGNEDVFVMDADGGHVTNVTQHEATDGDPSWTPDGKLLFSSNRSGAYEIYIMNREGGDLRRVTTDDRRDALPAMSPDGDWIAFQRTVSRRNAEVWITNVDGGTERRLTDSPFWDGWPRWSPNGNEVLFSSNRTGSQQLYSLELGQMRLKRLTAATPGLVRAHWSPSGDRIVANVLGESRARIVVLPVAAGRVASFEPVAVRNRANGIHVEQEILARYVGPYGTESTGPAVGSLHLTDGFLRVELGDNSFLIIAQSATQFLTVGGVRDVQMTFDVSGETVVGLELNDDGTITRLVPVESP